MSAFPSDIQEAADRVYGELGRGAHRDTDAICEAIMAERNRCREIASKVIVSARMGEIDTDLRSIAHTLDFAIRKGGE